MRAVAGLNPFELRVRPLETSDIQEGLQDVSRQGMGTFQNLPASFHGQCACGTVSRRRLIEPSRDQGGQLQHMPT